MNAEPELQELLAAEYVLGTLSGPARDRFAARVAEDADVAAAVVHWQRRLDGLSEAVPDRDPPARALDRVMAAVGAAPRATPPTPDRDSAASPGLWRSLALWRSSGTASAALVVVLLAGPGGVRLPLDPGTAPVEPAAVPEVVAEEPQPVSPGGPAPAIAPRATLVVPPPVAVQPPRRERVRTTRGVSQATPVPIGLLTAPEAGVDVWLVRYDATRNRLVVRSMLEQVEGAGENASFELWIIPPGSAPESLGVLESGRGGEVVITPSQADVLADATLAVSIEPLGGSPTGAPTGPVVRMGRTVEL